ncbi:MAG: hypothetical protein DRP27_07725 [Thermotogae bacterium]|nr:MAG: hypothetical protein DRP27_07725 [Thermotogota bacterium]
MGTVDIEGYRGLNSSTKYVYSGTYSYHVIANSSTAYVYGGRSSISNNFATNLGSGVFLNFSVYPVEVGPGRGYGIVLTFDDGFWLANGTFIETVVLGFWVGSACPSNETTDAKIERNFLISSVTANTWNTFSVNITKYLEAVVGASNLREGWSFSDDYNYIYNYGEAYVRTEAFFDRVIVYVKDAPADFDGLWKKREEGMKTYWSDTFRFYPAVEFSSHKHMNYFVYNETPYVRSAMFADEYEVVQWAHKQGYPISVNHPGTTSDYSLGAQGVIDNNAWGADLLEVWNGKRKAYYNTVWDALLSKGVIIMGVTGADSHSTVPEGDLCTVVYSPSIEAGDILKSLYEGRCFIAANNFTGKLIFNIKPSCEPYPARYIVPSNGTATLYLKIDKGLQSGWKLCWIRNGTYFLNETITGDSLEVYKEFVMSSDVEYYRVEIRGANNKIIALSEPIFFKNVKLHSWYYGLHLATYITETGRNYTTDTLAFVPLSFSDGWLIINVSMSVKGQLHLYVPWTDNYTTVILPNGTQIILNQVTPQIVTLPSIMGIIKLIHGCKYGDVYFFTKSEILTSSFSKTQLYVELSAPGGVDSTIVIYTSDYGRPTVVKRTDTGKILDVVPSLSHLDQYTDCWYYNSETKTLYVKVRHHSAVPIIVSWEPLEVEEASAFTRVQWEKYLLIILIPLVAVIILAAALTIWYKKRQAV